MKEFSAAARERRWKSGRRGGGGGERDAEESEYGEGARGLGVLGQRQVTPRWANDTVWLHNGSRRESVQGRVRAPPQTEIRRRADKCGEGWRRADKVKKSRDAYVTLNDGA